MIGDRAAGLSTRAYVALDSAGVDDLADIGRISIGDLKAIPKVGMKTIREIIEWCASNSVRGPLESEELTRGTCAEVAREKRANSAMAQELENLRQRLEQQARTIEQLTERSKALLDDNEKLRDQLRSLLGEPSCT